MTEETCELTNIIDMNKPIDVVTKIFLNRLKDITHKCFTKVKIVNKPNKDLNNLYNKRRLLRSKTDSQSKAELEKVETELCNKYSEVMYKKIMGEVEGMEDTEDGGFNPGKL